MSAEDFSYSGTELDALAGTRHYYRAILHYFRPYLGRRVIEIGAGIGTFADQLLAEAPQVRELVLYEPARNNVPRLESRFRDDPRVRVVSGYFDAGSETTPADAIVMVNVLEHVEHDTKLLADIQGTLAPGGAVLIFVPALPVLYGTLDRVLEHFRRYTRDELRSRLVEAGFRIETLRYMNLPGVVPWFVTGRILRRTTLGAREVQLYDRLVMPWLAPLERLIPPPFGQSLVAIGVRGAGYTVQK